MKKQICTLFFSLLLFLFLLPTYTFATCSRVASYPCNTPEINQCTPDGGTTFYCCSESSTECQSDPDPAIRGNCAEDEINTAIGCISFGSITSLSRFVLGWSIGIAGGIAFVLSVGAGFMISTSAGNPKRLQAGQELLNSALAGLLFLIFSVFILRLIGVDILGIPGL
ncbi:hypothetical protein KKB40_02075 [Patescibacteria group bacterium]|nr:hypothetical protein [Patescibacteria group bacterium]